MSVFGPGVGECIVSHLGDGQWLIVDSCVARPSGRPIALEYLESIGVRAGQVKMVVVTHWHDDHMRGASQIFDACEDATVSFSAALRLDEFKTLLGACKTAFMAESGLTELRRIIEILQERKGGRPQVNGPSWAIASKTLFQSTLATVTALSPSDGSVTLALNEFARLLPREGAPKRNLVAQKPNATCVVLWLQVGELCALLGADLETTRHPHTGWSAIVSSKTRPAGSAQVYKVAHHGSENADHDSIWASLLRDEPVAIVTPYTAGRKPLPSEEDLRRLSGRTEEIYLSAGRPRKRRHQDAAAWKVMRQAAPDLRPRQGRMGQVRFRAKLDGSHARTDLFGGAVRLEAGRQAEQ